MFSQTLLAMPVRSFRIIAFANKIPALLTSAQVCERLTISDATLRRYAKTIAEFPRKIKIGPRRVGYDSTEIENYIEARRTGDRTTECR